MCSDCEDEPMCGYCGEVCFGCCDDPDTCTSCWYEKHVGPDLIDWEEEDEALDTCVASDCSCECHDSFYEDLGWRFEAGVRYKDDDEPPHERQGVFPLLKLPGEIRDKIYGFAFLQAGIRRHCQYHRGTIHTALLSTCRQVYKEAGHLPLSLNTLEFDGPLSALDFLGFKLIPTQRDLVKGLNIEYHCQLFGYPPWKPLMRELVNMSITHLGLTIKGPYNKDLLVDHQCFTNRFQELKDLQTFDMSICSAMIPSKDKPDMVETIRERLINGYVRPKDKKKCKPKRPISRDSNALGNMPSAKKLKKGKTPPKHQVKIDRESASNRLGLRSGKSEREAAELAKTKMRNLLLKKYDRVKRYATAIESDATLVKIRLEDARKAAEAIDETKFRDVTRSIVSTLEERFQSITMAREDLSQIFGSEDTAVHSSPSLFTESKPTSSQGSVEL